MLRSPIVRLVDLCTRHAWPVIALALLLSCLSAIYAAKHFAIATDIKELFPRDLPWTQRAYHYLDPFPQEGMLVVVDAPTPELVDQAAAKLTAALAADREHFRSVQALQGGEFFARNALLYPAAGPGRRQIAGNMDQAGSLIGSLSADPSLRGVLGALNYGLIGRRQRRLFARFAGPADDHGVGHGRRHPGRPAGAFLVARAGRAASRPNRGDLRRFIQVQPVLDYSALEPGRAASEAVTAAAQRLNLAGDYQARVRLTGLVPMNDAQFSALNEHAGLNAAVSLGAVLLILWLALRSWRIILAAVGQRWSAGWRSRPRSACSWSAR